jgi:hypothetical protein
MKTKKPYLRIEIERSAKNKEYYARIITSGNSEITFQTEGHKNLLDVRLMVTNTISAIERGDFVISEIPLGKYAPKAAKPRVHKEGKLNRRWP